MAQPDNHIDELGAILKDFAFSMSLNEQLFQAGENSKKTRDIDDNVSIDKTIRQIEDFYRNKILEAERNLLRQLCWDGMDEDTGKIKNGYVGSLAKAKLKELDVNSEIDWLYSLEEKLQHDRQNNIAAQSQPTKQTKD
jgi:hypothetical protein